MTVEQANADLWRTRRKLLIHRMWCDDDGTVRREDWGFVDWSGAKWGLPIDTEVPAQYPTWRQAYEAALTP